MTVRGADAIAYLRVRFPRELGLDAATAASFAETLERVRFAPPAASAHTPDVLADSVSHHGGGGGAAAHNAGQNRPLAARLQPAPAPPNHGPLGTPTIAPDGSRLFIRVSTSIKLLASA